MASPCGQVSRHVVLLWTSLNKILSVRMATNIVKFICRSLVTIANAIIAITIANAIIAITIANAIFAITITNAIIAITIAIITGNYK
jgi:hypothetical protein